MKYSDVENDNSEWKIIFKVIKCPGQELEIQEMRIQGLFIKEY